MYIQFADFVPIFSAFLYEFYTKIFYDFSLFEFVELEGTGQTDG